MTTTSGGDMSPKRIQMSRKHPWRADNPDAVIVARPSRWGNPWRIGDTTAWTVLPGGQINKDPHPPLTREQTIESFRNVTEVYLADGLLYLGRLRGKDLACWCPLDQPCHADVLLELANATDPLAPRRLPIPASPTGAGQGPGGAL